MKKQTILVTGSKGMIGSHLVKSLLDEKYDVVGLDRRNDKICSSNYYFHEVDLADKESIKRIIANYQVDRIIHLAALAHATDGKEYSWLDYYHLNVKCAKNLFEAVGKRPVLFISTIDVFGFTNGVVNAQTELHPVSNYGKSKMMAEVECKKLAHYSIFRFSPIYTDKIKRDIQKRYYLKYPNIAYQIGKGTEYEILNINGAVAAMIGWCSEEAKNDIKIIKDPENMKTSLYISAEKAEGRARMVLRFPRWMMNCVYAVLKRLMGDNKYTYLLNKAVHPLRSE
ncbi:hypothetical protein SANA_29100 [Gottschalkiaceae bacterium SANA]|nr:hypothetical protein SANA_29100 [Gottschalkiaceae bacterium SANA]